MIGWERRVLLRHYVEQGMTKTELAERFGISRQTIHRWIREGELDRDLAADMVRYGPRSPVPTRLDPYKDIIVSRLGEFPRLTAVRLFDEIKRAGYPGGYTQVKEYVREIRPRPPEEPVVRFETAPGHQGQVDFAEAVLEMSAEGVAGVKQAGRSRAEDDTVWYGRQGGVVYLSDRKVRVERPRLRRRGGWRGRGAGVRSDAETGRRGGSDARGPDGGGEHAEVRPCDR